MQQQCTPIYVSVSLWALSHGACNDKASRKRHTQMKGEGVMEGRVDAEDAFEYRNLVWKATS